jgi:hypothetical protein
VDPVILLQQAQNRRRLETPGVMPPATWDQRKLGVGRGPLEQALRATDLLLNAGGFRAMVLDMGDIRPELARRVPLATWYRFRLQAEKARVLFLLLTRISCAGSCAAMSVCFEEAKADWRQTAENGPWLLSGLRCHISVARNRVADMFRKKPVASASAAESPANAAFAAGGVEAGWNNAAPWMR